MSEQVKRYISTRLLPDAEGWNQSVAPHTYVRASDYDALHAEAEALRAENGRLQADRDRANQYANQQALECNKLSTDLEAARGLLRESRKSYTEAIHWEDQQPVMKKIDAFLTAFPVPEVRCQTCDGTGDVHRSDGEWLGECHCVKTEQGERQPVAVVPQGLPELLESVRLSDEEAKPHCPGATYWNNAVVACQVAIRDALYTAPIAQTAPQPEQSGLPDPRQWTDQQVLDFLGVALRNVDVVGTVQLNEIRQGFELVMGRAALSAQGAAQ